MDNATCAHLNMSAAAVILLQVGKSEHRDHHVVRLNYMFFIDVVFFVTVIRYVHLHFANV